MTEHRTGTREEWRRARVELLELEKEHTRRSDELARMRRELPWVRIDKPYEFETDEGTKTLAELFDGRSQLLVYHFYQLLDRAPKGRDEDALLRGEGEWWWRRHDEYDLKEDKP
jgi:predicted dithiol-disulfide oxidoreductase (DUF899 family)